jgi:hypothetical protein
MSKRFVDPTFFTPWCFVFLISLIWLLSGPVHAQSQPQGSSVSAPKSSYLSGVGPGKPFDIGNERLIEGGFFCLRTAFLTLKLLQSCPPAGIMKSQILGRGIL